jgi:hypothetical protein
MICPSMLGLVDDFLLVDSYVGPNEDIITNLVLHSGNAVT